MRLTTADGTTMRALNLNTASAMAIAHLQQATGLKLAELTTMQKQEWVELPGLGQVEPSIALSKVMEFLSEHTRGNMISWDEVLTRALASMVYDSDEERRQAEQATVELAGEGVDPTQAGTDTPADATPAEPVEGTAPKASTPASKRSGARSRGSSSRSASAR